jgi:Flp pilus assembly protein TadG
MIFFYFGLAEFCQGYMAQKRASHSAAMVADLVAQRDSVTHGEVDDIFEVGELLEIAHHRRLAAVRVEHRMREVLVVTQQRGKTYKPRVEGQSLTDE